MTLSRLPADSNKPLWRPSTWAPVLIFGLIIGASTTFAPLLSAQGKKKYKDVEKDFKKDLRGRDFSALSRSAKALVASDSKKAVKYLIKNGLSFTDPDRRQCIVEALADLRDKRDVDSLAKELKKQKAVPSALTLIMSLQRIPTKPAFKALVKTLKHKSSAIRGAAAKAIGKRGDGKNAVKDLQKLLKDDSLRVQFEAANALNTHGQKIKGYEQSWGSNGLPDKLFASKFGIVFDTSNVMHDRRYTPVVPPKDKNKAQAVTALAHVTAGLDKLLGSVKEDQLFSIGSFTFSLKTFESNYSKAKARTIRGAKEWLKGRFSKSEERDILKAVKGMIEDKVEDVLLIYGGLPRGGVVEKKTEVMDRIVELAVSRGVRIHTVAIVQPPEEEPSTNAQKARVNKASYDLREFGETISQKTGGHFAAFTPPLFNGKVDKTKGDADKKGDPSKAGYQPPKPENGRLSSSQVSQLKKDLKKALEATSGEGLEMIEKLSSVADNNITKLLLKDVVFHKDTNFADACIKGLRKNSMNDAADEIVRRLKSERDVGNRVLLLQALPESDHALKGLVGALGKLKDGDDLRYALERLTKAKGEALAEAKKFLKRKFKKSKGLTAHYRAKILGEKTGRQVVGPQDYLPKSFVADGVAFVVDVERATSTVLWAPPKKKPAKEEKSSGKKKKKPKKSKKDKKDSKPVTKNPITRLQAMTAELQLALEALGKDKRKASVLALGESPTLVHSGSSIYDASKARSAVSWLSNQAPVPNRDVAAALKKALRDPSVEEIYILTCGTPLRADLLSYPKVAEAVNALNRKRKVHIHITAVFGLDNESELDELGKAKRDDEINEIKGFFKPLAEDNGGSFQLRLTRPPSTLPSAKTDKKKK